MPASNTPASAAAAPKAEATGNTISIEDFSKLDLRIGTVLECSSWTASTSCCASSSTPGSWANARSSPESAPPYAEPEKLIGRNVVFIANLAPRKMRFGVSEGMILFGWKRWRRSRLLDVDAGALPGATVR